MAEAAAAVRAAHKLYEKSVIFDDPFALQLTSPEWRFVAKNQWLYSLIVKKILKVLRPAHGQVLARSRYTEDRLENAISNGTTQYLLLGAGLDSFVHRRKDLISRLKIFEVDHPETQELKKERIASLELEHPKNLHYLPIDFRTESLSEILERSSLNQKEPVFISWLGTVPYLKRDVFFEIVQSLSGLLASKSELVFDYANITISSDDQPVVEKLMKFAERRGEPLITQFDTKVLNSNLNSLGYNIIENISQAKWRVFYYENSPTADLCPISAAYIAHLRVRNLL